jgi:hypothetical protein
MPLLVDGLAALAAAEFAVVLDDDGDADADDDDDDDDDTT